MDKFGIISAVSKELDGSLYQAQKTVDSMLRIITEELGKGEKIKLVNFGEFEVVKRAPRKWHNPHTDEIVPIPAKNEAVFKCGKRLKELINEEEEWY